MSIASDVQSDFNATVNSIGGSVVVFTNVKTYNIYGDYDKSGTALYVSGATVMASVQPRTSDDLEIKAFGDRADGVAIGYFKSGVVLNIGYRVSGLPGDYKINAFNPYYIGDNLIYTMALLDKLNK